MLTQGGFVKTTAAGHGGSLCLRLRRRRDAVRQLQHSCPRRDAKIASRFKVDFDKDGWRH